MSQPPGIESSSPASRLLLAGARIMPEKLGGASLFRKFVRRNRGAAYHVRTRRGFSFSGTICDSVDNRIAIHLDYEPALSDFIARHVAGRRAFLDIGCNIGWFSCLAASLPDRPQHILSVDANPRMVDACRQNLELNGFEAATRVCAAGPAEGRITLHVPERRHSRSSVGLGNAAPFGETRAIEVDMLPLGELLRHFPDSRCDLIKMDIEGYELETLRHVPEAVIANVGMMVLEHTRSNLEGCGFSGMTLGVLPWLDRFLVREMDDDGHLREVAEPASHNPDKTTYILSNRSWDW